MASRGCGREPFERTLLLVAICWAVLSLGRPAAAGDVGYAVHAEGAAARMVGDRKVDQFGWGAAALAGPELTLGAYLGIELPLGIMGLTDGEVDEPGMEQSEDGSAFLALPGVRLRPFGRNGSEDLFEGGGLWLAACGGLAVTGDLPRAALGGRLGYDLSVRPFRFGPYGGYLQIVETESEVMPEDARIVLLGLHGSFEPRPTVEPTRQRPAEDHDRDGDGIVDRVDRCPDHPEDFDGFQDQDGCPEADNDLDGIPDPVDRCPLKPEDRDYFEDEDGCPDEDNDQDGVLDAVDGCPLVAEDIDGFDDEDGCPEDDNDGDGIFDQDDECPNDPETVNEYRDEDGCPDAPQVRVVGKEILLDDRVYFRVNSADIQFRSWRLIDNVATLLKANPQYVVVHVQGHADDTGDAKYNQGLSVRRGMSVRDMLIGFGVSATRLTVEGYGESRPADAAATVGARRKNRRVEFHILKRTLRRGEAEELSTDWLKKAVGRSPAVPPKPTTPRPPPGGGAPAASPPTDNPSTPTGTEGR